MSDCIMMDHLQIRIATKQDAPALLAIYAPYVEHTAITFEYDVPTVLEFANRMETILPSYPYLVAELDGKAVGYAYASRFKSRPAYDWAVEVSIYVDENYHGKGIGSRLYAALENSLRMQNILNVNACIAYPAQDDSYLTKGSVLFHEHCGYQMVGTFHQCGYKFNRWYDMVWMEKHIGEHAEHQPSVIPFCEVKDRIIKE